MFSTKSTYHHWSRKTCLILDQSSLKKRKASPSAEVSLIEISVLSLVNQYHVLSTTKTLNAAMGTELTAPHVYKPTDSSYRKPSFSRKLSKLKIQNPTISSITQQQLAQYKCRYNNIRKMFVIKQQKFIHWNSTTESKMQCTKVFWLLKEDALYWQQLLW